MWLLQDQADTFGSTQGSRLVSQSKDESFAPGPRTGRKWQGQEVEVEETMTGREDGIESLVYPQASAGAFCEGFSLWSGSPDPDYTGPLV